MEMSQSIDLCILLGCDYLEPIKGIGPKSALNLRVSTVVSKVSSNIYAKSMPLVFYTFLAHDENRQAEKEEATADKEDGKKKRGGIQVSSECHGQKFLSSQT